MTMNTIELTDCEETDGAADYTITRWTHSSGAYVELRYDADAAHPLEDAEGIEISFREGDRYCGTMPDHPRYPVLTCPVCDGYGATDDGDCTRCSGAGDIEVTLLEYFAHEHGAVAIHEFDAGSHGEARAVIVATDSDWGDPDAAVLGGASEYRSWSDGDCWGIVTGGPGVDAEAVWGFIGREHAESEAAYMLRNAIEDAQAEHVEAAHCAARDIITS